MYLGLASAVVNLRPAGNVRGIGVRVYVREWLSVAEAAIRLGCSQGTVRRRARQGQIAARQRQAAAGYVWEIAWPVEPAMAAPAQSDHRPDPAPEPSPDAQVAMDYPVPPAAAHDAEERQVRVLLWQPRWVIGGIAALLVLTLISTAVMVIVLSRTAVQSTPAAGTGAVRPATARLNLQTWAAPLFAPSSPWNTPVPTDSPIDRGSAAMIAQLAKSTDRGGFWLTSSQHGPSLWYADSTTPLVTVNADSRKWWDGIQAPIPAGARPSDGPDGHLVIWQIDSGTLYEFWEMKRSNGGWAAGYGVTFDAGGPGYQMVRGANSARASGVSLMGGVIRYDELARGQINHALAMVYPYTRGKFYAMGEGPGGVVAIASHSDNSAASNRQSTTDIPEGGRLRLKSSVDIDAKCAGIISCKPIAEALRTYGAYVVDTGPDTLFYLEDLQGKSVSFDGLLDRRALRNFKAADFEVLALPELTPYSPP